ncbi:hypothetical protein GIB67_005657 [Kingdonia uniflora]|uniref:Uncharacterized protein n=1 Tax=Kingdonia uniflora TaxID=39325 RepID=A0A7J7NHQ6_9MAGN|nr:hypothetical protein GIB67_005657 [Kingdonia uniflora]
MEIESQVNVQHDLDREKRRNKIMRRSFLFFNCALLGVGITTAPLFVRLYFLRGGARIWFSSWLQSAGFPILFLAILLSYFYRCKNSTEGSKAKPYFLTWRLFIASAVIGVLMGADNYLYASGAAKLPVSTSSLLLSTQLGFTAGFAFLIVKQKFTSYSINSIFLLLVASLILGLHANGDRPNHESNKTYYIGFVMMLAAAALYGFLLPMIELTYMKTKQNVTYYLVMEMQLVISIFATIFCSVGMLVNKDFQV